ncbi:MAG TPA: hypothetical protein VN577_07415 [Terriglobales bacterium]|nr:hypothetical protein [Terriglobales bacterium]
MYKRTYRPYTGRLTTDVTRFGVLVRYGLADIWSSRITNVLFVVCMLPTVIAIAVIYIMNNDAVRLLLAGQGGSGAALNVTINEQYFFVIMQFQCWLGMALTAWVAPRLISADMSNNALPTIFSHPISRLEYVLAKMTVLGGLLSAITWVPLLLLFGFQSFMSATPWASSHWHLATGAFMGSLVWILLLCLLALAVASWVKWRIVATGLVFASMLIPGGMGAVFNAVMRTNLGTLVNIPQLMSSIWRQLLHVVLPQFATRNELPLFASLLAVTAMCVGCGFALNARIRAREVVRG